jgi:hypothetical protein
MVNMNSLFNNGPDSPNTGRRSHTSVLIRDVSAQRCRDKTVRIGKVEVRVRGVRISEEVEVEEFDCRLRIACAQIVTADYIDDNFRPQLRFGSSPPGFHQLLSGLGSPGSHGKNEDKHRQRQNESYLFH